MLCGLIHCVLLAGVVCVRFGLLSLRAFGCCLCVCFVNCIFRYYVYVNVLVCCFCARWFVVCAFFVLVVCLLVWFIYDWGLLVRYLLVCCSCMICVFCFVYAGFVFVCFDVSFQCLVVWSL